MQLKSFLFNASDGAELWVNRWIPDDEDGIKGIVQLHHGLAEHTLRYDRFGSILSENGYVLNAYDMRGHGKTGELSEQNGSGKMGKIADKNGFDRAVEDLNEIIGSVKAEFPGKPVFLLGHSFGSFVSQGYIEKYSKEIDGCILCGTAGPRGALINAGKCMAGIVKTFKGKDSYSPFLAKLAFGSYNKRIQEPKTSEDWLSRNEFNVSMYHSDRWCGIPLTTSFFVDLMTGLKKIHAPSNIKKIDLNLPVFFIWGEEDPVGDYGASISKLIKIYEANGMKSVKQKSYPNDRHEILNEDDKETVENDILSWLSDLTTAAN